MTSHLLHLRLFALLLVGSMLSGCTSLPEYVRNGFKVGPNYAKPPAPVAPQWIDADDVRVRSDSDDLSQWWKVFNDPVLDDLICHAYRQNLTLREAGFRVLAGASSVWRRDRRDLPANAKRDRQLHAHRHQHHCNYRRIVRLSLRQRRRDHRAAVRPVLRRGYRQLHPCLGSSISGAASAAQSNALPPTSTPPSKNYDDVLVTLLGDVATNYVQLRVLQQQIELLNENAELQTNPRSGSHKRNSTLGKKRGWRRSQSGQDHALTRP